MLGMLSTKGVVGCLSLVNMGARVVVIVLIVIVLRLIYMI